MYLNGEGIAKIEEVHMKENSISLVVDFVLEC